MTERSHVNEKPSLFFVATTPFAVNAFLRTHLIALAQTYDITLCVNSKAYPLAEDIAQAVSVHQVDISRKIAPWQDLRALLSLMRIFRERRPDVLHSITPKAGLLAMMAGWLVGVPSRFHTFTGQVWTNKRGLERLLLKSLDQVLVACATRVFADSYSQCRFLESERVVCRGGVTVLGNGSVAGVDLRRFRSNPEARSVLRAEVGLADNAPVFVFVGRLVRDKGLFDLIHAFAIVNARYPHWELWIVGPDEAGLKSSLQLMGDQLAANVKWFGPTSCPERYMASADVFLLPSYREGFGAVVIEAAACGIPTIAYRIDGVVDAIVENYTGCFVEKGNVVEFADAIVRLGTERGLLRQLGVAAQRRAIRDFSSDVVSATWLAFYKEVLARDAAAYQRAGE